MPGGDRTGPMRMGPKTGRAAGFCAGYDMPGYMNSAADRGYGMGFGRGRGFGGGGRGFRHRFYATGLPGWMRSGMPVAAFGQPDPDTEKQMLKNHSDSLQAEMDVVRKRLEEIEVGSKGK